MWKRMQGYGREKEKTIGNPVLLDTTFDAETLQRIPNISDIQSPTYPHALPPGHVPQSYSTISPQSPSGDYQQPQYHQSSALPPPPPGYRYDYTPSPGHHRNFSDISPPSSPEPNLEEQERQPRRFRSMRDVSPIDQNRARQGGAVQHASNIPVLRKVSVGMQNKPAAPNKFWGGKVQPNSKVKWDEYSGEPTSGNKGKPAQVSPTTYAKSVVTSPEAQPLQPSYQVSATGPLSNTRKPTPSERANRLTSKLSPVETSAKPREPWKGASGRVEIAPPLEDQPLKTPPLFVKKRNHPENSGSGRNTPSSAGPVDLKSAAVETPAADTSPVADPREELDLHEDPIKPIVPLKVGRNSPPRSVASPVASPTSLHHPYSYPSPISPTSNLPHGSGTVEQPPPQPQPSVTHDPSTPANTKVARKSVDARKSVEKSPDLADDKGPTSRFSWTTYNTSTTYQHSPPPSPRPPMPDLPSIITREPPVKTADKMPSRKPITISPLRTRATTTPNPPSPRPQSTISTATTHKALPRPPPELATTDHIEVLEAQLADLRLRRSNVDRLLRDLNNKAPPNPLVTNFKRMRLVEKRKKDFEDELDEIKAEEHDVGLKLHRAWRKREREDPNGSECAIWVRRVTR